MGDCDAEELFWKLLRLINDIGLLSAEYGTCAGELTGNIPQTLSHIALVMRPSAWIPIRNIKIVDE